MAISTATLAPIQTSLSAISNVALVVPNTLSFLGLTSQSVRNLVGYQPQNPVGVIAGSSTAQPPSFMFHYEGEQYVENTCDITDHYVENNTAVQDQIAIRPTRITTHGFIGELNNVPPSALAGLQSILSPLGALTGYTPGLSKTAQLAYNEAFFAYQSLNNAYNLGVSAVSSITGGLTGENVVSSGSVQGATSFNPLTGSIGNNQNKQQTMFQLFFGYQQLKYLFTVQTPWAIFQNMAIESLKPIQTEETRMISEFHITFKQIRFANSVTQSAATQSILDGRLDNQAQSILNQGQQSSTTQASLPYSNTFGSAGNGGAF